MGVSQRRVGTEAALSEVADHKAITSTEPLRSLMMCPAPCAVRNKGKLASWPHLEPDPKYELEKHIEMYLAKNEIRGEPALAVFGQFYHD